MLQVVCLICRDRFPDIYVDRLYAMVQRHLDEPFHFTCLTDQKRPLNPEIKQVIINDVSEKRGSRNKLQLFNPDLLPYNEFLFLDISLICKGPLRPFLDFARPHDFVALQDWKYDSFNSCVMWIRRSEKTLQVWKDYSSGVEYPWINPGDQDYISGVFRAHGWYDQAPRFPRELVASYKLTLRSALRNRKAAFETIKRASIIKFHGQPRPHQLMEPTGFFRYIFLRDPRMVIFWNFLQKEIRQWWR